ncbi:hypothetical protein DHEL01_v204658 [Diaporthe helianthi]|uniref:DUF6604 domain-containing protein n=1 Tax=Diaporthe helianthi TaxID=158607 RepID=A0A2P5I374_DIAHE|nr:hypothetical protein DHEL01_v204658 [Diaporthe helianthi]
MLPESLKSSYAQYKDDTDRFATWLLHAAEKCGYQASGLAGVVNSAANGNGKTKSKSKSKPKAAPVLPLKYKATISELRTIGEVVAKSSLRVPNQILAVARRAVTLRKDAASWFVGKGDTASNKRHAHFVSVLEKICESLEWRTSENSKDNSGARSAAAAAAAAAPANGTTGSKIASEAWVNQFATLTVEEPEDIPDLGDSSKQLIQVELIEDAGEDAEEQEQKHLSHAYFRIFCLFRDLQNMRSFIQQTWEEYRDNKLDAMTASVVTDTAMQLARAAAEELTQDQSLLAEIREDEVQAQLLLYNTACLLRGNDASASFELGLTFNVGMAQEAEWCFIPTSTLLISFVPVMQQSYIPDMKKGHFGNFDPKADRSRMSVAERFNEDKILLLELLPEFCLIQAMGGNWPVRDEFTHGFCEFARTKKVTLWLCFAAQVLLDIHHTLRSSPTSPWSDLRMTGLRISKIIADFRTLSATHPKPAFWPKEGDREIEHIHQVIERTVKFDPQHLVWHHVVGTIQEHEEHFFLNRNPVLAGLMTFHLTLRIQVIGQGLVTQWYDVQQMAFLYNLVNTTPEMKLVWRDIEAFINIHGENHIFVGNRPKDAAESLNRLEAATGISSISRFARDSRRTGPWHRPDGKSNRLITPTTKVANMFRENYTKPEQTRNIANADIGRLLDDLAGTSANTKKGNKRGKKNTSQAMSTRPETLLLEKWSNKHSLGALQFLALVRTKLHEEEPALMFNYFGMHQRCIEMLRRIRTKEHHKFAQYFTPGYMPDESMISNLVILVHHVARGSAASSQAMGLVKPGSGSTAVSRIVMSCGDVMREYLRTKGDVACKELRIFCKNKTPLYVEAAGGAEEDEEAQKDFVYWFGLEEVVDPKAMASLMTGIPMG